MQIFGCDFGEKYSHKNRAKSLLSLGLQFDLENKDLQDFAVLLPISESTSPTAKDSGKKYFCNFL